MPNGSGGATAARLRGDTVRMRVAAVGLVAVASVFAVVGDARTSVASSGLRGIVMRGPTKPVCNDDPCEEPAAGVVLRFTRSGRIVAAVTTNQSGRYFVKLAPGSYVVTTPRRRVGTGLTPRVVRAHKGQISVANFHLDTGIQ
jgi:hypothetical protein